VDGRWLIVLAAIRADHPAMSSPACPPKTRQSIGARSWHRKGTSRVGSGDLSTRVNDAEHPVEVPLFGRLVDGIADAGVSVARLIPNPWIYLGAAGQVFRGDSGTSTRATVA